MVGVLTGGRVILDIGPGCRATDVETSAAPMLSADANRELFEAQFEIIMKGFKPRPRKAQAKPVTWLSVTGGAGFVSAQYPPVGPTNLRHRRP